jgi:hypothetical protein
VGLRALPFRDRALDERPLLGHALDPARGGRPEPSGSVHDVPNRRQKIHLPVVPVRTDLARDSTNVELSTSIERYESTLLDHRC